MKKWSLFLCTFVVGLILFPKTVQATCDYKQLAKLKSYAGNIKYDIDYTEQDHNVVFRARFVNLPKYLYIQDQTTGLVYSGQEEFIVPNLSSGKTYIFAVKATQVPVASYKYTEYNGADWSGKEYVSSDTSACTDTELKKIYVTIPTYNPYYDLPICSPFQEYKLCYKWAKHELNQKQFEKTVATYQPEDVTQKKEKEMPKTWLNILSELYLKFYYIPLSLIIIGSGIIIYREKKKESFNGW